MSEEIKSPPDSFIKWVHGLRREDKDMGYGYIKRSNSQLKKLYEMYLESFNGRLI